MRSDLARRLFARLSCAMAGVVLLGCESSTPPVPRIPKIALISGGDQTAEAGTPLPRPIVVIATDSAGNALGNQRVTFAVTSGGGRVAPETASTSPRGFAQTSWTLGAAGGPQTMIASVGLAVSVITVNATTALPKLQIVGDPSYYYYGVSQSVGPGQYLDAWVGPAKVAPLGAPLPVSFSHAGTLYTNVPGSVTIQAGEEFSKFRITAVSLGVDSIVASAPGFAPLTMGFVVDSGSIRFGLNVPMIPPHVGGVKEVILCSGPQLSATPTTFSIAADTIVRFVTEEVPPIVISSATVPGDNACTYFAVQGLAAGTAKVTVTGPSFRPFTTTIVVTP